MFKFSTLPVCLLILFAGPILMAEDAQEAVRQALRERRIAPLEAAGIDIDSVPELIRALDDARFSVRAAALYVLKEKKAQSAIPKLRVIANGPAIPQLFKVATCEALVEMDRADSVWTVPCKALLASNDVTVHLRAAAVLARIGDADGWGFVRQKLLSPRPDEAQEAALIAPAFEGLKTPVEVSGRIHLTSVAGNAFPMAGEASQMALASIISRTATSQDAQLLSGLVDQAKSPYLKISIQATLHRVAPK